MIRGLAKRQGRQLTSDDCLLEGKRPVSECRLKGAYRLDRQVRSQRTARPRGQTVRGVQPLSFRRELGTRTFPRRQRSSLCRVPGTRHNLPGNRVAERPALGRYEAESWPRGALGVAHQVRFGQLIGVRELLRKPDFRLSESKETPLSKVDEGSRGPWSSMLYPRTTTLGREMAICRTRQGHIQRGK